MYEGALQNTPEFMYKKLCVYSYMFKLHSPSKYSPFDAVHLLRHFFHCSKQFWTRWFDAFQFFCCFLFRLFHISKTFPFEDFFHGGGKVAWGEIKWTGRVGMWVMMFLIRNCWPLSIVGAGALINHPSWNGQMCWVFKKNSLKLNATSHTTTS